MYTYRRVSDIEVPNLGCREEVGRSPAKPLFLLFCLNHSSITTMAITLLTSPPPALTPPELQDLSQSTPASFEGIAPLLRHFEEEVEITVDPAFEGFTGGRGSIYVTEE